MPYICMASNDIPAGVLQITDLWPNVSQHNNPTYPPGQTRYVNRPPLHYPSVGSETGLVQGIASQRSRAFFDGIGAYLVDRVEPGADNVAQTTFTLNGVQAGDTLSVKGVYFEFTAAASDYTKAGTVGDPFLVNLGADDDAAAAELTVAFNNANVAAAMDALATLNLHTVGTNVGAPSAVVRIQPENGAAALVKGITGVFAVTVSNTTRIQLDADTTSVATAAGVSRMYRDNEDWNATNLAATVDALQARVDAGSDMTLAAINVVLLAQADADLGGASITGSNSTGTLAEFLSVLAGRTYRIDTGESKFTAVPGGQVYEWDSTQQGGFTTALSTWDTDMLGGEWGATTGGVKALRTGGRDAKPSFASTGDTVNVEVGGYRQTFNTTAFQASITNGQLAQLANGVTLFPDQDVQARVAPFLSTMNTRQSTLTNQRVVTVYDDDGTALV